MDEQDLLLRLQTVEQVRDRVQVEQVGCRDDRAEEPRPGLPIGERQQPPVRQRCELLRTLVPRVGELGRRLHRGWQRDDRRVEAGAVERGHALLGRVRMGVDLELTALRQDEPPAAKVWRLCPPLERRSELLRPDVLVEVDAHQAARRAGALPTSTSSDANGSGSASARLRRAGQAAT